MDEKLLELLACPKCKDKLRLANDESSLICETCRLKYPIRQGIPVLLAEEASSLDNE